MRRIAFLALLACLVPAAAFAQGVGINSTSAPADTSALLDLTSTSKGFLPPRMTAAQRAAIVLPATGLVVYQTDVAPGLWINGGTPGVPDWKQLIDNTSPGGSWLANGTSLYYNAGKVGIGLSGPAHRLSVEDPSFGLRVQTDNTGSVLASFGGVGTFFVDAPFIAGGRLALLENGNLGVGRVTPTARLDVLGGNFDVINGEGDVRMGSDTYRLKMGVATSGGGAGAANIMQQGVNGGYNVLSLGSQGNKVLYVNGNSASVGIGTDSPNAPLGFPAALGKKITLYPGGTGDVGIGVAGNRLKLYVDTPNGDVALGYDQAGTFNERFAVKSTAALAVNGATGSAGQVLSSGGPSSAATWVSPQGVQNSNIYIQDSGTSTVIADHGVATLPDLSKTLTLATPAKAIVSVNVVIRDPGCTACGASTDQVALELDGTDVRAYIIDVANGARELVSFTDGINIPAGTHTISVIGNPNSPGRSVTFGDYGVVGNSITIQVVPQ